MKLFFLFVLVAFLRIHADRDDPFPHVRSQARILAPVVNRPASVSHKQAFYAKVSEELLWSVFHQRKVVTVNCFDNRDWRLKHLLSDAAGEAIVGGHTIWLRLNLCQKLDSIVYQDRLITLVNAAWALSALAHETVHLSGVSNEAQTECFAGQLVYRTSLLLGIDQQFAVGWGDTFWSDQYPNEARMYRSAACRPGGVWDLQMDRWTKIFRPAKMETLWYRFNFAAEGTAKLNCDGLILRTDQEAFGSGRGNTIGAYRRLAHAALLARMERVLIEKGFDLSQVQCRFFPGKLWVTKQWHPGG